MRERERERLRESLKPQAFYYMMFIKLYKTHTYIYLQVYLHLNFQ